MPPGTRALEMPALGGQLLEACPAWKTLQLYPVTAAPSQGSRPSLATLCSVANSLEVGISDTGRRGHYQELILLTTALLGQLCKSQ